MILIATPVHIQVGSMYSQCRVDFMRLSCETFWNEWPLNHYTTIVDVVVVVVVGEEWKAQGSVELFVISIEGVCAACYNFLSHLVERLYLLLCFVEWVGGWMAVFLSLSSIVINVVRRYCLKWCNAAIVKRLRVCFTFILLCFNAVKTAGFAKW